MCPQAAVEICWAVIREVAGPAFVSFIALGVFFTDMKFSSHMPGQNVELNVRKSFGCSAMMKLTELQQLSGKSPGKSDISL